MTLNYSRNEPPTDGSLVGKIIVITGEVVFFSPCPQNVDENKPEEDENNKLSKKDTLEDPDH